MEHIQAVVRNNSQAYAVIRVIVDVSAVIVQIAALYWYSVYNPAEPLSWSPAKYTDSLVSAFIGFLAAPIIWFTVQFFSYVHAKRQDRRVLASEYILLASVLETHRKKQQFYKTQRRREQRDYTYMKPPSGITTSTADKEGLHTGAADLTVAGLWSNHVLRRRIQLGSWIMLNSFKGVVLAVYAIWTLVATVSAGYWWRIESLPNDGGSLVWSMNYVPRYLVLADTAIMGILLFYFMLISITTENLTDTLKSSTFWIIQLSTPLFGLMGVILITLVSGVQDYSFIALLYPMRYITLWVLTSEILTKEVTLKISKGNEVRAVVIRCSISLLLFLLTFNFIFYMIEYDPANEWLNKTQGNIADVVLGCLVYIYLVLFYYGCLFYVVVFLGYISFHIIDVLILAYFYFIVYAPFSLICKVFSVHRNEFKSFN